MAIEIDVNKRGIQLQLRKQKSHVQMAARVRAQVGVGKLLGMAVNKAKKNLNIQHKKRVNFPTAQTIEIEENLQHVYYRETNIFFLIDLKS